MKAVRPVSRRQLLQAGVAAPLLVTAASAAAADQTGANAVRPPIPGDRLRVAFLMDAGTTMIDFAGPWEVFQDAKADPERKKRAFYLYSVGAERKLYNTTGNGAVGLEFMPAYTYADAPQPDIVVIPAQDGDGEPKVAWLKKVEPNAKVLMSVCTGAFWLAEAGFLDGKTATTHHEFYDMLKEQYPKVNVVRGRRFVDNGKFITAGGLTSGIDAALHVVKTLVGQESAESAARYMEHDSIEWTSGVRAKA